MPPTFTHTPTEVEQKEPGIGGKPPLDRRPTGGGGGGGATTTERIRAGARANCFTALGFSSIPPLPPTCCSLPCWCCSSLRGRRDCAWTLAPTCWPGLAPLLLPPILYLNTAVLLLSSLTMERARLNIFREVDVLEEWLGLGRPALRRTLPWVAATLALGIVFLAGQVLAWRQLTAQGFAFDRWSTPASYFFYVITGLHAAHLVAGIAALIFCLSFLGMLKRVEYRQIAVDSTAWYWHAMSLAWLLLMAVLAAGQ
jgi:cytochrome c oxidase subunit 3